jgi:hypothetical protein
MCEREMETGVAEIEIEREVGSRQWERVNMHSLKTKPRQRERAYRDKQRQRPDRWERK